MKLKTYDAEQDKQIVDFGGFYETWHAHLLDEIEIEEFVNAYCEAHPNDSEAVEWMECGGHYVDEFYTAPDNMLTTFNHKWRYDYQASALHYLGEMIDFINSVYELNLQVDSISWTKDNFIAPDLLVLKPMGWVQHDRIMQWLYADDERMNALEEKLRDVTTPKSGYVPFYTYEQLGANDGIVARMALEMMIADCLADGAVDNWYEYAQCNLGSVMCKSFGKLNK
nr:MAG TPA: hypothetical protein [Caudoviricetes sp.]